MGFFRILLTLLILLLGACSKKSQDPAHQTDLLSKLPASTIAYYSWGPLGDLAKNPAAAAISPLDRVEDLRSTVSGEIDAQSAELFSRVVSALKSSKLISSEGKTDSTLELLFAVSSESDVSKPELTLFARSKGEGDFRTLIDAISAENPGSAVTPLMDGAQKGLILTYNDISFHLRASKGGIAISSSANGSNLLFESNTTSRYTEMSQGANYKALFSQLSNKGSRLAHGFIDIERAKSLVASVEDPQAKEAIASLPLSAGAMVQQYSDAFVTEAGFIFSPTNENQKLLIQNLSRAPKSGIINKISSQPTLFINIDGRLIDTIVEGALSELDAQMQKEFSPLIQGLRDSSGLGVVIDKSRPENPFPDISLILETPSAKSISTFISDEVHSLLMSQNMVGGWMEKTINGEKVRYLMSPLGIGLFIFSRPDAVLISSSETGIEGLLRGTAGGQKVMADRIKAFAPRTLEVPSLIFGYANMNAAAKVVDDIQGTMALFTGGSSAMNAEQVQSLKRLGETAFSLGMKDNSLIFRSSISAHSEP